MCQTDTRQGENRIGNSTIGGLNSLLMTNLNPTNLSSLIFQIRIKRKFFLRAIDALFSHNTTLW